MITFQEVASPVNEPAKGCSMDSHGDTEKELM